MVFTSSGTQQLGMTADVQSHKEEKEKPLCNKQNAQQINQCPLLTRQVHVKHSYACACVKLAVQTTSCNMLQRLTWKGHLPKGSKLQPIV